VKLRESLDSAWSVLEAGGERRSLLRSVTDLALPANIWIGIDGTEGRELHFEVPLDAKIPRVPRVHGVRVVLHTSNEYGAPRRSLVLRCSDPSAYRVFTQFSSDVLEQVTGSPNTAATVLEVLSAWREMFRRAAADSDSHLRGVYGELHELAILAAYSANAMNSWQGPSRMPRDFERGRLGLEVKSSRTLNGNVEVHGLEQLWARDFDILVLATKHVTSNSMGQTISELVDALVGAGLNATLLWDMLANADLSKDKLLETPGPRFLVSSTRYYLITSESPVFTPDSLKTGALPGPVSRLSYQLDTSALATCPADVLERLRRGLAGK